MNIKNILDEAKTMKKSHEIKHKNLKVENKTNYDLTSSSVLKKIKKFNKNKRNEESSFNLIRKK